MESNCSFLRSLFGAFLFLGIIWFSFIGVIDNASPASRRATDMQWKLIGREKHVFHWHSDFYSVSKRRVPNGPDPIHNRRVENSKQPPIRA
ncbi:unnamed protein product [Citrullus colocynthis]|uniref:CLAVATA3/ESR (CLE)-related protein 25 n=1 Tax=Citrullus colocynthis TaxID=252529 RepID=A0ABP0XLA4_9ROSI